MLVKITIGKNGIQVVMRYRKVDFNIIITSLVKNKKSVIHAP